ncbi:hypothetical protein Y032_0224g2716 [Ancylostoma ceylanicum]|uniref:Uncharacterized protein n=1 Tax=Ancylostoma ceylanicum TaxID=53326 RepID=A0A016SHH4_9BILA|nr:hypothetical protein Y032_0224g2716 [Ancylostoma ceylanicum]
MLGDAGCESWFASLACIDYVMLGDAGCESWFASLASLDFAFVNPSPGLFTVCSYPTQNPQRVRNLPDPKLAGNLH